MADSIQMHGQEKLQQFMQRVVDRVGDASKLWHDISDLIIGNTQERIRTGIGTDDKPWQKSWRAQVQGGQTLRDTGRLHNSIFAKVQGNRITIGTNVKYAPILHFGGTIRPKSGKYLTFKTPLGGWVKLKSVTIPPRPFLGISVDDSQEILFEIEEYLYKVLIDAKH
ncbi:phage virion morphogenesis protein [Acinetobacter piscicola]|uniref:phage virion morphogenesis protein n=1 Tax=Acinetobacter piscicola TaxID=2006115 RepID=UPI001021C5BF|nr:phage virion morphogenesis protein [Acinetobacter piscicola]RYL25110.1 virion morphogenesis protein [Acinetobacter piscicola]